MRQVRLLTDRGLMGLVQMEGEIITLSIGDAERMIASGQAEPVEYAATVAAENAALRTKTKILRR